MFREDFAWGVATSAYQIEGTDPDDGRGKCIWDTFSEEGHTRGDNASVACDHMHRYKEDFALMKELGIRAYRFSVNWCRILPNGTGEINPKGIAMYRDMIMEMRANGIEPFLTMYHWDLPQALEDKGGWLNPEIVDAFGEYAKVIAENFSDIVENFFTINEPQCIVGLGYVTGVHAPGRKLPLEDTFKISINVMKAHGTAVKKLREFARRPIKIGYAPTCTVAIPASESPEDIEAAREKYFRMSDKGNNWAWNVAWFSDPVLLGEFPAQGLELFKDYIPEITKEDIELIHQPIDFVGQNIYNGYYIKAGSNGKYEDVPMYPGFPQTGVNWPVMSECLYWGIRFAYERYHLPIYITENGMACHDCISVDGKVHDPNRQDFLDRYISAVERACDEGMDVRGYFLWSFTDNFEWEQGFHGRFGIVYVDFRTGKRIPKDSAYWYKTVIESNGGTLASTREQATGCSLNRFE
ncbi:MAG: GH1 family beta-glucosidase [Lachnospiraceae bacterium]|nr:GH1 family beta-glucosidase [Lachnospiraceae bacterium]